MERMVTLIGAKWKEFAKLVAERHKRDTSTSTPPSAKKAEETPGRRRETDEGKDSSYVQEKANKVDIKSIVIRLILFMYIKNGKC